MIMNYIFVNSVKINEKERGFEGYGTANVNRVRYQQYIKHIDPCPESIIDISLQQQLGQNFAEVSPK